MTELKDQKLWVENRLAEIYHEMKESLGFSLRRTASHSSSNGDEFCIYDPVARWTSQAFDEEQLRLCDTDKRQEVEHLLKKMLERLAWLVANPTTKCP